ncbi:hypothetical protein MPTK1_2g18670 [Marchantia polymorpha subsp. ruderalis]|uniref:Uncharacterized protein n=1 Tax=Marchantia polymorpha TaxID=3197 RepID=A0A2R6W718_MARPO|nr:hypothetical protein MARPO_0137s0015 [Marchantia polymorpha]BBN02849.1 hypothetical protein Mp_2g18670 [Marchantia polymorpha subsp. ruderalis]|eukprot:PTQ29647.1 hypothetical protein MARPO_0137s0015 [Marchantia polymorpha]
MARRVHRSHSSWNTAHEEFHSQPVAIQNNILYNKPRAALVTIPQLRDNPLFETTHDECRRLAAPRLSLEESHFKPVLQQQQQLQQQQRRTGSLSLSAKDYEGIWRAVQEDVSKSSSESKSALEDFKEFRQKLALRKQDMTSTIGRSGGASSTGSTRSMNISPSRPTSPLKRLSVITSRKSAAISALNPQLSQQKVPPAVQKIAVTMRAEGLFKLPSPASISPVPLSDPPTPPLRVSSTPPTKRRFSLGSYRVDQFRKSADMTASSTEFARTDLTSKSGEIPEGREESDEQQQQQQQQQSRTSDEVSAASDEIGSRGTAADAAKKSGEVRAASSEGRAEHPSRRWGVISSISEKKHSSQSSTTSSMRLPVPCGGGGGGGHRAPKTPPQRVEVPAKKSSSSSTRDWKVRCIPIPRPVCYSANILE